MKRGSKVLSSSYLRGGVFTLYGVCLYATHACNLLFFAFIIIFCINILPKHMFIILVVLINQFIYFYFLQVAG
jgi:hypothetical protein